MKNRKEARSLAAIAAMLLAVWAVFVLTSCVSRPPLNAYEYCREKAFGQVRLVKHDWETGSRVYDDCLADIRRDAE